MALGRYKDFNDCVDDQVNNNDKSQAEAKNICGALEKRMSNAAIVSEALLKKYGINRLPHEAAQRVRNAPMQNNNNSSNNQQTLERIPAEQNQGDQEDDENETPIKTQAIDMEMEGPTFDDFGADQISAGTPAEEYDMEDGAPSLDDNAHAQKHEGFTMQDIHKQMMQAVEADKTPDQLFIVDAALMKQAAKCTEGKYKGEICMGPPDGWPASENGKLSAKRVRAAITYGVQYGKIATLKKNGLCRYAKAVGVDTKFCQGGTQESAALHSASMNAENDDPRKIKPFEQNNKLFIKAFLLDRNESQRMGSIAVNVRR